MTLDLARIAADTPGAADAVFLDSAGSSLPPTPVLETVVGHLRREAEIGGYRAAEERAADLAGVKESIGRLLGAPAAAVALVDSATRAWTQAFYAVALRPGDRILLSGVEYASNAVAALHRAAATGAVVEFVPSDPTGQIDLEALAGMLDERVRLVSLVQVPTNGGLVNPVREVVDAAHAHGAFVLLDACQSIGQLRVDVDELGVDALSGTGRKWLRGPRGTGFLYVRPGLIGDLDPPVIDLHSATWRAPDRFDLAGDATRFELWESDVAGRLGLGAAVDYLLELGVDAVEKAVAEGAERLRDALAEIPGVRVRDLGRRRCGIVTFTVARVAPETVRDRLRARDVTVTVSRRGSTLVDMDARGLEAVVRASPHYFVHPDQLDAAVRAVAEVAATA
ncbi:aminotransferase class V-fold PLP-dependent enzyme [Planosporangium sp. 12N6]|uniref:aminotransferase class V-fold PLP-dependent enzyme n=1 Tax=Planosporangium spinosum TaxID=3402278 RepID=UPI003CF82261